MVKQRERQIEMQSTLFKKQRLCFACSLNVFAGYLPIGRW